MFRVEWRADVQIVLLELWALAERALRSRISRAVIELERRLSIDPLNEGESRVGDVRITFEEPLGISFAVDSTAGVVTVVGVWLIE